MNIGVCGCNKREVIRTDITLTLLSSQPLRHQAVVASHREPQLPWPGLLHTSSFSTANPKIVYGGLSFFFFLPLHFCSIHHQQYHTVCTIKKILFYYSHTWLFLH